jgi:hypothetical protein
MRWWWRPLCSRPTRCVLSGEVTHTNFIFFGLTRPRLELTIYRTRYEHANHYATDTSTLTITLPMRSPVFILFYLFFGQNFLVSFNILFENKNESKTIRVTCYLYKMMFEHRHLTRLIMGGKVSGFVWFHIIFIEFRCFVLNNKIWKNK